MKASQDVDVAMMQALEKKHGILQPEHVLAIARPKSHRWHAEFEWEDSVAGPAYRLEQARQFIRSIRVRVVSGPIETYRPQFVRLPRSESPRGYASVDKIASQRSMSAQVLHDEISRIAGQIERARTLAQAFGMVGDLEDMLQRLILFRERLAGAKWDGDDDGDRPRP